MKHIIPNTKDGKVIKPGMRLYWMSHNPLTSTLGFIVIGIFEWAVLYRCEDGDNKYMPVNVPLFADRDIMEIYHEERSV